MKPAILFVDDEKTILETLERQLSARLGNNFQYETAESVEEAWEVIDDLATDGTTMLLVISDWLMPGVKGDEFLVTVHARFPRTVKILLSGQADEEAIDNAVSNAQCTYIKKPWDVEQIVKIIQEATQN